MDPVDDAEDADVVVFMTCCVREHADERLRGQVASLKSVKTARGGRQTIAVGGCIGQRDGERLLEQLPHVDVVFGTHNVAHLPALIDTSPLRARLRRRGARVLRRVHERPAIRARASLARVGADHRRV
jgi:tRNA-2-methylthio-N6-dimethylallyladenosine synthase